MQQGVFVAVASIFVALLLLSSVHAQSCGINGLSDKDCDAVPDVYDNCPALSNHWQEDRNRDGIGDACAPLTDIVRIEPDSHLSAGEFAHVVVQLYNPRSVPLRDIAVQAFNRGLGIDKTQRVQSIPPGESVAVEFWLATPKCAKPDTYSLNLHTTYEQSGQRLSEDQRMPLTIEESDACTSATGALDTSVVDILQAIDVDVGEEGFIPITIHNEGSSSRTYQLSVDDLGEWGTWRLEPGTTVTIPAHSTSTSYLVVRSSQPGSHELSVRVNSGKEIASTSVRVFVRAALVGSPLASIFQIITIILLVLLMGIAIAIAITHLRKPKRKKPTGIEPAKRSFETHW